MVLNSPDERPRREIVYGCATGGLFALGVVLVALAIGWPR